ncbi:MAG: type II toxin-antitoxin system VapC family toxin [Pseudomonadota bacterium]
MEKIVLDTNILIEVLKGNQNITQKLETSSFTLCISSITVMELYFGALNKQELFRLKKFIELFEVIEINENISAISTELIFEYSKSHNLAIPDSLIAATAINENIKLYTLNLKDFKFIDGLSLL